MIFASLATEGFTTQWVNFQLLGWVSLQVLVTANEFGKLLDTAQREAVTIEKKGRPVAVLVSIAEYQRLQDFEDELWVAQAIEAEDESFLNVKESKDFLNDLRQKLQSDDV